MESVIDTSKRPLFGIEVEPTVTLSTLDQIFSAVEEELARHTSICILVNAVNTTSMELSHVRRIAEFGEKNDPLISAYIRAIAFVIPSAMVRGALKVAFQLRAPPHPIKICKAHDEAEAFLQPFLANLF